MFQESKMSTNIDTLVGLDFMSCRFSRGSTTFEFDGMINGEHHRYELSTSNHVCFSSDELVDIEGDLSSEIWPLLETKLKKVERLVNVPGYIFIFESGKYFVVWSDEEREMYICRNTKNGEWCVG